MMKKHCFLFLAAMMVCSMANAATTFWSDYTAAKSAVAPKIDGVIADGEYKTDAIEMNSNTMALFGGSMLSKTAGATQPGSSDLSGSFWITWDSNYLYVAARVKDSKVVYRLNQGSPLNASDGIQFCIDPQNLKKDATGVTTSGQKIIDLLPGQLADATKAAFWVHFPDEVAGKYPNTVYAGRTLSDGYEVEMALKWADMAPIAPTPAVGTKIGYMTMIEQFGSATDTNALLDLWWNAGKNVNMIGSPSLWNTLTLGPVQTDWQSYTAAQSKVAPIIDGTITDGEYLTAPIVMNHANMATGGGFLTTPDTSTDADRSCTYWYTWDSTYLYAAVRVEDNEINNSINQGSALNGTDVVQFCLDPMHLKTGDIAATTTGLRILDVAPGQKDHPNTAAFWQHWPNPNNVDAGYPASFPNTKFASRKTGMGYEIECAVKWSDMTPNPPTPYVGKQLGYLSLMMDIDGGALKNLEWNVPGTAAVIGDASKWNTMTLGTAIDPWTTYTVAKAAKAPVIDGNINFGSGEWNTAPIQMSAASMAAFGGSMLQPGTAPAETQGTQYLMWDNTYLYWAAHVTDASVVYLCKKGTALNGTDGVQLCLDPLYTRSDAKAMTDGAAGEVIVDLVPGNSDVTPIKADLFVHGPAAATPAYANAKFASRLIPGGYEVEAAMKWSEMATTAVTPVIGGKIGYMTMLMQFKSTGLQDLWWNAGKGVNMIGNASQWNTAILGDVSSPVTLVPVEMSNFNVE